MEKPLVSVIITTYNYKNYIIKAIESVLIQDISTEIIIVDDCSSDGTEEYLKGLSIFSKLKYIKNELNLGVAKSRNIGVKEASGKYIAYLDADDSWKNGKLKKQVLLLESVKGVFCYTARENHSNLGEYINTVCVSEIVTYKKLLYHNMIACSSVVLLREVALEFPMQHDEFHEDYLNWLCILQKHEKAYGINEPLLIHILSKNGKSRNIIKSLGMTFGVHRCMKKNMAISLVYTISHYIRAIQIIVRGII